MRVMIAQWVAVLAIVCGGAACSTTDNNTPASSGSSDRAARAANSPDAIGLLIEPGPAADIGYRIGWAADLQLLRGQEITSVTVLDDIVIIVEDPNNIVTARRVDNGELLWKVKIGSVLEQLYAPSRDGDQVFIHSGNRFFTLRLRDGEVQSVANLETPVASAATYSPQTRLAILAGSNGLVFGHSVDSNFTRWRYSLANRIANPPALVEQDVFIVDTGGTYVMLETATGGPLWRNRTLGPVTTAPKIQGTEILVASEDGKLYAFNRSTGQDTWQYLGAEQPLISSPVPLGRLIVQPLLPDGGIVAVDALDGEEVWRSDVSATPVLTRESDMLLYTDRRLLTIDLDDGRTLLQAPTQRLREVVEAGDGAIILVSPEGKLLRLSPL